MTPDGRNPCARLDDRLLGGFVASGKNLPAAATAKKVVGFSWTARQGGSFPMPYTNIVRIDADSLTLIDNPTLWSGVNAFIYADFAPNDRGNLGGVLDQVGTTFPTFVATLVDQDSGVPPPYALFTLGSSDHSPNTNEWGDYNTVRRLHTNGYQFVGAGHVLVGGGSNGDVVSVYVNFWRERGSF